MIFGPDEEAIVRAAAAEVYKPEGVDIWMNAPNPWFHYSTPMQMIAAGDTERVLQVLEQLTTGSFG